MSQNPPQNQERPKLVAKKTPLIIRARITEVRAKKHKDGPVAGIEIQVDFEKVSANKQFVEIWFLYRAIYAPDLGEIEMKGLLLLEITEKKAQRISEAWNQSKEMDQGLASNLLQQVNYKCGTEGVMAAKLVDLPSPIIPPPIGISREDAAQAPQQAQAPAPEQQAPAAPEEPAAPPEEPAQPPPPGPPPAAVPPPRRPQPASGTRFPGTMPTFNSPFTGKKPH